MISLVGDLSESHMGERVIWIRPDGPLHSGCTTVKLASLTERTGQCSPGNRTVWES